MPFFAFDNMQASRGPDVERTMPMKRIPHACKAALGTALVLAAIGGLPGCAAVDAGKDDQASGVKSRPDPMTGSMMRRDRGRSTDAVIVDPDAIRDGARGSTPARTGGGGP
jgi:hypothetical protein